MTGCRLPASPLAMEREGLDACVHCGFCLQACPTYLTLEDENDSPRGRLVLMRSLLEGTLEPDSDVAQTHIARCLGCRACETACPSGVPYGHLLEATRATLVESRPIPLLPRAILFVFERALLTRAAMFGGRIVRAMGIARALARLPGRFGFAMAMLASTARDRARSGRKPAANTRGPTVALLTGCVMEGLFRETNRATERALDVNGYAIRPADSQRCCGALHAHAGDREAARRLARANVEAFERANVDYVCANAAGCGAMMKEYGVLFADDPEWAERSMRVAGKVRDVSELLAAAGPARGGPVRARVAYDAPCHALHAQRLADPPLAVLRAIPGLELVPLHEYEMCCGGAGIYNLIEPEVSNVVLERKLANVAASAPELVATGNPGCLMQIGAGLLRTGSPVRAVHPVELLDGSYGSMTPGARPST